MAIRKTNGTLGSGTRFIVSDNIVQFDTNDIHTSWPTNQLEVNKVIHDDASVSWSVSCMRECAYLQVSLTEAEAKLFSEALAVKIRVLEPED